VLKPTLKILSVVNFLVRIFGLTIIFILYPINPGVKKEDYRWVTELSGELQYYNCKRKYKWNAKEL